MRPLAAHPPRKPLPALNHRVPGKRVRPGTVNIYNINYCEIHFPSDPEALDE